jgi:hypothetical protein
MVGVMLDECGDSLSAQPVGWLGVDDPNHFEFLLKTLIDCLFL